MATIALHVAAVIRAARQALRGTVTVDRISVIAHCTTAYQIEYSHNWWLGAHLMQLIGGGVILASMKKGNTHVDVRILILNAYTHILYSDTHILYSRTHILYSHTHILKFEYSHTLFEYSHTLFRCSHTFDLSFSY
jgi:hypothetical protein